MAVSPDDMTAASPLITSSPEPATSAIAVVIPSRCARDFADMYPSTEVIGVDISPIQPDWVPPNCKFQIDDIEQPWTWPMSHFDYVHISHLEGSVAEWPALYAQAFAHIKSGGFVEVKEIDVELCSKFFLS
ncbi:hypothetical protein BDP67DRAFT_490276 [Colletotrichum lupini]|nr:hypothetical protein BDP67DRAFT_490276 [Colletotrichum lupini]